MRRRMLLLNPSPSTWRTIVSRGYSLAPKWCKWQGGLRSDAAASDTDSKDLIELISKVRGFRILSAEKLNGKIFYDEAMNTLSKNKYEDLMDVADKDSHTKFMVREKNGIIKELLMLLGTPESFTLLSMLGDFTCKDLNILAEKTNMPRLDEYNKGNRKCN